MKITLDEMLRRTVSVDGSDLHVKADNHPICRVYSDLMPQTDMPVLDSKDTEELLMASISEVQQARFAEDMELDFAYEVKGLSRFRGNIYRQRGAVQGAFRVIPYTIRTMQDLNLPPVCKFFAERPRGIVLVTGPAGSGKSTTQAAFLNYINETDAVHIMTVEDPLEFVHTPKKALVNQRELGTDTMSFANALKYVLRQDPDVILIGEMRDLETIHLAITAAETGHLVFGTLHTPDAVQTIDRIIDVFPLHQQSQVRMQLSSNLVGVVSQQLCKRKDGKGRVAAYEVLVGTSAIRNIIREAKTFQLSSQIQTGTKQGMLSLDLSLANLHRQGLISREEAMLHAKEAKELEALISIDTAEAAKAATATKAASNQR